MNKQESGKFVKMMKISKIKFLIIMKMIFIITIIFIAIMTGLPIHYFIVLGWILYVTLWMKNGVATIIAGVLMLVFGLVSKFLKVDLVSHILKLASFFIFVGILIVIIRIKVNFPRQSCRKMINLFGSVERKNIVFLIQRNVLKNILRSLKFITMCSTKIFSKWKLSSQLLKIRVVIFVFFVIGMVFSGFIVLNIVLWIFFAYSILFVIDTRIAFTITCILIMTVLVLIIFDRKELLEVATISLYYFLVIGVIGEIMEYIYKIRFSIINKKELKEFRK